MNHKISVDYIIFWSSILTALVIIQKANGILTDSNDLHCTQIQCPTKCPEDSYLISIINDEEEDFEDYKDELFDHDPYIEKISKFEEIPPEVELHDFHSPQHFLKERQKREVLFQEDIEKCCEDQKCVCNKCQDVPKCAAGYVAVEVLEGQSLPGNCCSIYRCLKKEQCQLGVKQSWWTSRCTKCSCFGESELCLQICPEEEILQNCYSAYWQKPMMNGAFWKEGSCTSCSCEQGERRCFTSVCPKLDCKETIKLEYECCAKCANDEKDVRSEIDYNNERGFNDVEDVYATTSATTEIPIASEEHSSSYSQDHSILPTVGENLLNETQTTSPFTEAKDSSTALDNQEILNSTSSTSAEKSATFSAIREIKNAISSTFQPESKELVNKTVHNLDTSTATSDPNSTLSTILEIFTTTSRYSEESRSEVVQEHATSMAANTTKTELNQSVTENVMDSLSFPTSTIRPSSTIMVEQFTATISATEPAQSTTTEITDELNTKAKITTDNATTIASQENFTSISTDDILFETSTLSTVASATSTLIIVDSFTDAVNFFTTNEPTDVPVTFSSTTNMISSSTTPLTTIKYTSNTLLDFINSTSTPLTSAVHSTEYPKVPSTLTTSSPYSTTSDSTTTSHPEQSTSTSTTTTSEPLEPLHQSYGDFVTNESTSSTHNQMRIVFDKIDYVVMIVLFIGSLLCISLGLIIRHNKNRKKMYSSIPNSETSLSQTSTNTVLTV